MIQTTAISYINASVNSVIILNKYTSLYKNVEKCASGSQDMLLY